MTKSQPALEPVDSHDPTLISQSVPMVREDSPGSSRRMGERMVSTFPHLIVRELILFQVVVIGLTVVSLLFNAPLEGMANPAETPDPSKAPWYFLGLQELLHYFPPLVAGVLIPGLVMLALATVPFVPFNQWARPLWSGDGKRVTKGILMVVGSLVISFSAFQCWAIVVPTLIVAVAMFLVRPAGNEGGFRRYLSAFRLPEWIMTWFMLVATTLTLIGTFFRGPGWSLVWPWNVYFHG